MRGSGIHIASVHFSDRGEDARERRCSLLRTRKDISRMTLVRRDTVMIGLGLLLSVGFLGFAITPAQALSISGTYTDIAFGSAGTGGSSPGLQTGLVGAIGSSLGGGFPPTGTLGNNFWLVGSPGVTADGFGTRVDNAAGLTLNFPTNFFAQGHVNDSTKCLVAHWTAAFSN